MSSDVIWHIRDKLWPMPKHGSIKSTYVRCLAVTCHLHFWQNDRELLRATAVTRGWNEYRNKSQHRKSTPEKKILPSLLQGFEPATFQSRVRRSNHWTVLAMTDAHVLHQNWTERGSVIAVSFSWPRCSKRKLWHHPWVSLRQCVFASFAYSNQLRGRQALWHDWQYESEREKVNYLKVLANLF